MDSSFFFFHLVARAFVRAGSAVREGTDAFCCSRSFFSRARSRRLITLSASRMANLCIHAAFRHLLLQYILWTSRPR